MNENGRWSEGAKALKKRDSKMAVVVVAVCVVSAFVVLGAILFQVLPRLFPRLKKALPSQAVVSYVQLAPASFIFPILLWSFFRVYLPAHVDKPFSSLLGWAHIVFALYMLANATFNYYAVVFVDPGYPQHQDEFLKDRNFVKSYEMCVKCNRVRSAGTHHCSWCNTCVQMMDHHCPFTNNCTGLKNYIYYYSFLGYSGFGLLYASYLSYFPFSKCVYGMVLDRILGYIGSANQLGVLHQRYSGGSIFKSFGEYSAEHYESCKEIQEYSLLFAPALGVGLFIGFLFAFQTLLLMADMSMVDFYETIYKASSVKEFFRIMYVSVFKRKKYRFTKLILKKKSQWWKFFVPCLIDVTADEPAKDL